ncbi:hypothetical protein, partial [Brevundimonas sp.]|uniref:hypothetical protein n=1 Tax=Brevundimonas sp. TaxID=1871086 RepID=UPI00391A0598
MVGQSDRTWQGGEPALEVGDIGLEVSEVPRKQIVLETLSQVQGQRQGHDRRSPYGDDHDQQKHLMSEAEPHSAYSLEGALISSWARNEERPWTSKIGKALRTRRLKTRHADRRRDR